MATATPDGTPSSDAMSVYTVTQTANLCQVSLRTVQRRMPQLQAAGAWKNTEGKWSIPVEAMTAAGLTPGRPVRQQRRQQRGHRAMSQLESEVTRLKAEAVESQLQAAEWRRRVEVAEAIATERERIIKTQALALKMLEPPPPPTPLRTVRRLFG